MVPPPAMLNRIGVLAAGSPQRQVAAALGRWWSHRQGCRGTMDNPLMPTYAALHKTRETVVTGIIDADPPVPYAPLGRNQSELASLISSDTGAARECLQLLVRQHESHLRKSCPG